VLGDALRANVGGEGLRTAVQCQGRRENGEIFQAHIWFSSYMSGEGPRLAAIVVDTSEEMREREEAGLQQLLRGNRIAAAAVAHEVRNFSVAMKMLCGGLRSREELAGDEDLRGLSTLIEGLETIASVDLQARLQEEVEAVALAEVLASLRIVTEPAWRDIDGEVHWPQVAEQTRVLAEPHGLLQAFLNLVQNSHRAVQDGKKRELWIEVECPPGKVVVRIRDSGPGIARTDRLFEPLQNGAQGSGMGLYLSRFLVRSYGGELRYEPKVGGGSCFAVELQAA
jgi:signal transduction histidine kinase